MDRHLRDYSQHTGPLGEPTALQQAITDRLNDVLDMMIRTGVSVPTDRGLAADGLVRLTIPEAARIATQVAAAHVGSTASPTDG